MGTELRKVVSDTTATVVKTGTGAMSDVLKTARQQVSYRAPFFTRDVNKSLGQFQVIGGVIALIFTLGLFLLVSVPFVLSGNVVGGIAGMIFLSIAAIVEAAVIFSGMSLQKLVRHFYEYGRITGERAYITIKELADKSCRSEDKVKADLKKMKMKGFLPTATFDRDFTTLMLTDEV